MAQNFIGSNNINLLQPVGQFGSRFMNGQDSASPRYIFTKLSDITQIIYNPLDTKLLTKLKDDDGNSIEPEWYIPILPICLVNGTIGIGTGFSTGLPSFNPKDIVRNIRLMMKNEPTEEMIPWFRGFSRNSAIKKIGENRFVIKGRYSTDTSNDILHITELPIGVSTNAYKEFLTGLLITKEKKPLKEKDGKTSPTAKRSTSTSPYKIKDFRNNSGGNKVDFTLFFEKDTLCQCLVDSATPDKDGLTTFEKNLKLGTTLSFPGKMVLRGREGSLIVYSSIDEILHEFYNVRIEFYKKRHAMLLKDYKEEADLVNVKAKFVKDVIEGRIVIFEPEKKKSYSKAQISDQLEKLKYPKMLDKHLVEVDQIKESDMESADYDYLLGMKIYALTKERVEELLAEMEGLMEKYNTLKKKSPSDLWQEDLISFEAQYNKDMKDYESELAKELAWGTTEKESSSKSTKTTKTKVVKKEKDSEPEKDLDSEPEHEPEEEPVVVVKKKKTTTSTTETKKK
jgi:DNA topoisomerase-2